MIKKTTKQQIEFLLFFIFHLPDQIEWMMILYTDQSAASLKTSSSENTMGTLHTQCYNTTASHTEEITDKLLKPAPKSVASDLQVPNHLWEELQTVLYKQWHL